MLMALMMIMSYAVFADADPSPSPSPEATTAPAGYSRQVTFNGVKKGDTINAYRLVSYDSTYNNYVFYDPFDKYVSTKNTVGTHTNTKYLASLSNAGIGALLSEYAAAAQEVKDNNPYSLPTVYATGTAGDTETVALTLEPGYYMILGQTTSTNGQLYSPTCVFVKPEGSSVKVYAGSDGSDITTALNVTMKKENAPTLDKESRNSAHDSEAWSKYITSNTDDIAEFRIKVDIPSFSDGTVLNLSIKDVMTNMEYVADSIKVYSDADLLSEITNAIPTNGVTVGTYDTEKHTQTLDIKLDYEAVHPEANVASTIYVYYKTLVHSDSSINNADADNKAKLVYSNVTTPDISAETPEITTEVDLFEFKLEKVDESGAALPGAKFKIYSSSTATTPINFSERKDTDGNVIEYYPDKDGTVTEIPCDATGKLHIVGLDVGSYYFEETTVPTGYYKPTGRFVLTLVRDTEKNKLGATTSFAALNTADNALISSTALSDDKVVFTAVLKNSATPILPTAGGMGTTIFTIMGIILMAMAFTMVVIYRRRLEETK
jgi:hypothetical protein